MKLALQKHICTVAVESPAFLMKTFSHVFWQFDIWMITVNVTVNWHNCQLFPSKEFLLLFQ